MTDTTAGDGVKTPLRGAALGEQNGRLMAEYDCYTLASNPHTKGTTAHAAFVEAFNKARAK